jgi:hypothetical protein
MERVRMERCWSLKVLFRTREPVAVGTKLDQAKIHESPGGLESLEFEESQAPGCASKGAQGKL